MNRKQNRSSLLEFVGRTPRTTERGFTLIELMIVMAIILILIGIAAGNYQRSVLRSREAVLKQDLAGNAQGHRQLHDGQAGRAAITGRSGAAISARNSNRPDYECEGLGAGGGFGGLDSRSGKFRNHGRAFGVGQSFAVRKYGL